MVLKLHGHKYATCTQRVLVSAAEIGIEVELVAVDLQQGEHKSADFLKLQPFGQVPALEDTEAGLLVFECVLVVQESAGCSR